MTVERRGVGFRYSFQFEGRRYVSPMFGTQKDAAAAEEIRKTKLRRQRAGLEANDVKDTPRFTDWAAVTLRFQKQRKGIKRPDAAKNTLRMVLAFWGAKPSKDPVPGAKYHDFRLGEPIARPELIGDFERWMTKRGISGARKNHYRSACSMMYRVALLPENRSKSGVRENPFAYVLRDRVKRRTAVLEPDELLRWVEAAPLSVAVAVAVGSLAPALRLANVVQLKRSQLSADRRYLTTTHKADRETGLPLVIPISDGLQRVIAQLEELRPNDPFVVPIDNKERYWHLSKALRASITAAGLPYGRKAPNGVTFHSLRHMANTWLARWGASRESRQRALAHASGTMTDWYEHMGGNAAAPALRLIDEKMPVADVIVRKVAEKNHTATHTKQSDSAHTSRRLRRAK